MCECVAMKNQRPWLCVQLPVYAFVYRSIGNAPTVDRHVYAVHIGRCSCIFGWFRVEWGKGSKQHMTFFVDFSFFFRQPLQERINWRNNKRSEMSNTSTVDLMHSNETKNKMSLMRTWSIDVLFIWGIEWIIRFLIRSV